jgi:hypothetical protein
MLGVDDPYPLSPRLLALLQDMPLEELAFVPAPVRARHDGWTKLRQQGFILRLALGGCVSWAARGVGKTKASAYRLRERAGAGSFAAAWDTALKWGRDRTIDVSLERVLCGERVPVMRDGRCVGIVHRHDNRLAMAVLNALDRRAGRDPSGYGPVALLDYYFDALRDPANAPPTENKGFSRPT